MSIDENHLFANDIQEEIQVLESIYLDELKVQYNSNGYPETVSIKLHPSTADNEDEQYVCLTLIFTINSQYPKYSMPDINIRNPRGLADEEIQKLLFGLQEAGQKCIASPMMYEMIEYVKDSLTCSNVPHGHCVICMMSFCDDESVSFTKTQCYHYFHCHCLRRYFVHHNINTTDSDISQQPHHFEESKENKVLCPVCRESIDNNLDSLNCDSLSTDNDFGYKPDAEILKLQKKMATLYQKQLVNGGIIDLEEERNKFLIPPPGEIQSSPVDVNVVEQTTQAGSQQAEGGSQNMQLDNKAGTSVPKGRSKLAYTGVHGLGRGKPKYNSQDSPRPRFGSGHVKFNHRHRDANYGRTGTSRSNRYVDEKRFATADKVLQEKRKDKQQVKPIADVSNSDDSSDKLNNKTYVSDLKKSKDFIEKKNDSECLKSDIKNGSYEATETDCNEKCDVTQKTQGEDEQTDIAELATIDVANESVENKTASVSKNDRKDRQRSSHALHTEKVRNEISADREGGLRPLRHEHQRNQWTGHHGYRSNHGGYYSHSGYGKPKFRHGQDHKNNVPKSPKKASSGAHSPVSNVFTHTNSADHSQFK